MIYSELACSGAEPKDTVTIMWKLTNTLVLSRLAHGEQIALHNCTCDFADQALPMMAQRPQGDTTNMCNYITIT